MTSEALTASTITMSGHGGDEIEAYLAVPDDGAAARGSDIRARSPGALSSSFSSPP